MTSDYTTIMMLLIVFQIKHFICDFPLQREYMLRKTLSGWGFILPLAVHCFVHSTFSLVILLVVRPDLWYLCFFDFIIHFLMDRIKSGPKYLGRFDDKSKPGFWNALGFDQMIHHLTSYAIIWMIVSL